MKQGGRSRVTVGEGLVPHIEPPFFWLTDIFKSPMMMPTALGYESQCGVMSCNLSRKTTQGKLRFDMDVDHH